MSFCNLVKHAKYIRPVPLGAGVSCRSPYERGEPPPSPPRSRGVPSFLVGYEGGVTTALLRQVGVYPGMITLLTGLDLFLDKAALWYMLFYKGNIVVEQPVPNVGREA